MDVDVLLKVLNEKGLAVSLLFAIAVAVYKATRAVWGFIKPLITEAFQKHFTLLDTVIEKANKVDAIQVAGDKCLDGHQTTHEQLKDLQSDVRVLKGFKDKPA